MNRFSFTAVPHSSWEVTAAKHCHSGITHRKKRNVIKESDNETETQESVERHVHGLFRSDLRASLLGDLFAVSTTLFSNFFQECVSSILSEFTLLSNQKAKALHFSFTLQLTCIFIPYSWWIGHFFPLSRYHWSAWFSSWTHNAGSVEICLAVKWYFGTRLCRMA